jgi:hypothetical protein
MMYAAGLHPTTGFEPDCSIEDVRKNIASSNHHLLGKLKTDDWECELHKLTQHDAALGRMSAPVLVEDSPELHNILLAPRWVANLQAGPFFVYPFIACLQVWCRAGHKG